MTGEKIIYIVKNSALRDRLGATDTFLRRLEDDFDGSGELIFDLI